ncbi:MAG: o-succinylbenzoate synthase [Paludibacter sp.]|nr:o-succinylbenzoate synthase [Paludibacter sp.]MDD4198880.1 o-succinylbenzoate synthase [Paludibacter sp.]MDD4426778.1 o-succinylbenzoate synthase [Paludibacter sp.]
MHAQFFTRTFHFRFPAGTSRGVLYSKTSSFLLLKKAGVIALGECSTIPGLSPDPEGLYMPKIEEVCQKLNAGILPEDIDLNAFPSIRFGLEVALTDLRNGGLRILFPSDFTEGKQGIPINGLIWMGTKDFMNEQINRKLKEGYRCLKMKVGALDFGTEVQILKDIRAKFGPNELEIRLDANGAFLPENALSSLETLSEYHIHSVEQPVKPGQYETLQQICRYSPIPVALDEELIAYPPEKAKELLREIKPAYVILKPSLLGGFAVSKQWIDAAGQTDTGWWVTSALESNVGLNAIAQWAFTLNNPLPQGLGTGQLYHNNILSPLVIRNSSLWYDADAEWENITSAQ